MSQLVVNYSKLDSLVSEIDKVADYFGNRKETHAGNARRIGSVVDKRGNLASAVSELYSRNSEIVFKEENLTSFRTELVNFQAEAEQADQRVANRISNETSSFFYKTGIVMQATEAQSLWDGLCEGVSDICGSIKDFYEEYKEEIWAGITLVIDTAFVALVAVGFSAMILATAPIALLLATGFVFTQVAFNLAGSLKAMDYYCIGDKETARRYASLDLKDGFLAAGRAVDLEEESGIIYDGCNLAATIVLLYEPATMLKNRVSKFLSGSADDVIVGGSKTIKGGIETYQYNMIENSGPLSEIEGQPAKNFFGGKYNVELLAEDRIYYRAGQDGKPLGQWFTSEPAESVAKVRIDSAVKPQWIDPITGEITGISIIDTNYAIKFPKGSTVYTGPVGYQGGSYLGGSDIIQTFIETPWKLNIEVIGKTPLK